MNNGFKQKIIILYCLIFYILMIYKLFNGMFLFQLQPSLFYTRFDIFTWLFMQTGLHQWLLNNQAGWIIADALFYMMPLIYLLVYKYKTSLAGTTAIVMLLVNWCYIQCYTLYPSNSIEGHVGWLLFPVAFLAEKPKTFALLFDGLRYFFLFFFFSAAIWKITQGGIFNIDQMSGILLSQHIQQLTNSPEYWQSKLYFWLINHPFISYLLYLSAILSEFMFIIGFFTRKYDKWLAAIFIIFLAADHLIMRIPYYEVAALLLTLLVKERIKPETSAPEAIIQGQS